MKLYKDGQEVLVDKSQLKVMIDAGWSHTPTPIEIEEPEITASEENIEIEEEKIVKPKKTKKPKKISLEA